jgi:hypothetical protein
MTVARDRRADATVLKFQAVRRDEVPKGRQGKHKRIIEQLLCHIDQLAPGQALKISLVALPATKAQIRAALSRATHKMGLAVATSSDSTHLYLWKVTRKS